MNWRSSQQFIANIIVPLKRIAMITELVSPQSWTGPEYFAFLMTFYTSK